MCFFFGATINIAKRSTRCTIKKRFIDSLAISKFCYVVNNQDLSIPSSDSIHDLVDNFNCHLSTALDTVAPLKEKKLSKKRPMPWKTQSLCKMKSLCRKAERMWRKHKLAVHYVIYKDSVSNYNKSMHTERNNYFSEIIHSNTNNPRILFSTINSLLNPCINSNISDHLQVWWICNLFQRKILDKTSNRALLQPPQQPPQQRNLLSKMTNFSTINKPSLRKMITSMKPSTCFLDPIPSSLLKTSYDILSTHILRINSSLESGIFPRAYKTAIVIPLKKTKVRFLYCKLLSHF